MKFVCDLHLHSKYSRAVSQAMNLTNMEIWAKYKGINVLGTGDFTHPFWFDQLKTELVEAGNGLFKLKQPVSSSQRPESDVFFMLSAEISSIYSQGGKVRRIHNLFFFPKLAAVEKFNEELRKRNCNLRSDGRPIVGINSEELAKIAFSCDEKAIVIPAHVWTPWFSVYGSFSGFDSIEECFGSMAKNIWAIETGLSSDPAMNWRVGDLENRAIVSFSDAHSLEKMGREATIIEAEEIGYDAIYEAIRLAGPVSSFPPASARSVKKLKGNQLDNVDLRAVGSPSTAATRKINSAKIAFTIEFHPEEGKYHFTGHRNCKFSQSPEESREKGDICPVCHRPLTVGVMHRVEDLATEDRGYILKDNNGVRWVYPDSGKRPSYVSLVPLLEIIAEALGVGTFSKKVKDQYFSLVNELGSEFEILLKADLLDIARLAPGRVVEGIEKVRSGNIVVVPGYDGEYGVVKIWNKEDVTESKLAATEESQLNLFI